MAGNGSAGKMIYFVLYIVLISELLIVISERDELDEQENQIRDKMLSTIADSYKKPITLEIPVQNSDFVLGKEKEKQVALIPRGLVSDEEKLSIQYYVKPVKNPPPGWVGGTLTNYNGNQTFRLELDNQGNARFHGGFKGVGEFSFSAYFTINRTLPEYLKPVKNLYDALVEMVGKENLKNVRCEERIFIISVKNPGTGTAVGPGL
jgi:hypothetical protein